MPLYIKAIQGHTGLRRLPRLNDADWEVKPVHTYHVYHSGFKANLDSILRNGIIAGGPSRDQKRHQCNFSIADPRKCENAVTGPPVQTKYGWRKTQLGRSLEPIFGLTTTPYPADPETDAIYIVEVQRCNELGIQLFQNPTSAVLCNSNIPP